MMRALILDHLEMKRKWWRRKKGLNLTGAEEKADAKTFMWLHAAWKQEKETECTRGGGRRTVPGSRALQMFRFGLKLAPALTMGWVVSDVYSVSERRPVLHK